MSCRFLLWWFVKWISCILVYVNIDINVVKIIFTIDNLPILVTFIILFTVLLVFHELVGTVKNDYNDAVLFRRDIANFVERFPDGLVTIRKVDNILERIEINGVEEYITWYLNIHQEIAKRNGDQSIKSLNILIEHTTGLPKNINGYYLTTINTRR